MSQRNDDVKTVSSLLFGRFEVPLRKISHMYTLPSHLM